MKTKYRIIVAAMIVSSDHKILVGKQRHGGVYPDCWHLPGGGVDSGETKQQALIREMKEEIGLDISNFTQTILSNTDSGRAEKTDKVTGETYMVEMEFNTYQINLPQKSNEVSISLDDDLVEYKWVSLEDLKNYKHTPPSTNLFKKLGYLP